MRSSRAAVKPRHGRNELQDSQTESWETPELFVRPANENVTSRKPARRAIVASRVPYYYATVMSLVWISAVAVLTLSSIASLAQLAPGVAGLTYLSIAAIAVLPPMVMVAVAGSHVRGQVMLRASDFLMRETARLTHPVDLAEDRISGLYDHVADTIDTLLASLDEVVKRAEGVDQILRQQADEMDAASTTTSSRLRAVIGELDSRKAELEETGDRVGGEIETLLSRMENSAGRVANLLEGSSAVFNGIEMRTNDASTHLEEAISRAHARTEGFATALRHQVDTVERLNGSVGSSLERINADLSRHTQDLTRASDSLQSGADSVSVTITHAVSMVSASVEALRENSSEAAKAIATALDRTWDEATTRLERGVTSVSASARDAADQATAKLLDGAREASATIGQAADIARIGADAIQAAAKEAVRVVEAVFDETCAEATAVLRKGVDDLTSSGTATVQQAISDVLGAAESAASTLQKSANLMTSAAGTVRQSAETASGEIAATTGNAARLIEGVVTETTQRAAQSLSSGVANLTDSAAMASRQAVDAILRDTGEAANAIASTIERVASGVHAIRDVANLAVESIDEAMARTSAEAARSVQATAKQVTDTAAQTAQESVDRILKTAFAAGEALEGCAHESVDRMTASAVRIRDALQAAITRSVSEVEQAFTEKSQTVQRELGSIIASHSGHLEAVGRDAASKLLSGQQEVVAVFEAAPRAFRDIVERATGLVQQGSDGARAEVLGAISAMEQSQAQLRKFLERLPIEFSTAVDTSLAGFRGASRELSKDISDLLAASSEKMSAETRLRLETVVREHQAVIESATETLVTSLGNGPGQLYDAAATIVQQLNGVAGRIHASFESVRSQYLAQVDTLASDLERRVAENLTTALRGT